MQKLPRLSGKQVIKILAKIDFLPVRQRGSHVILKEKTEKGKKTIVVPNHKEVDKGTLLEVIRQADLEKEDFLKLVKK